ncbi:potassium channel family protein [Enterocloster citroniae]|nr:MULTISPECIES: TrkA family potassium uptake protein [Clostridia]MBS1481813.1 TrkA family potassium uptake protein [Clostridium sp.]MBT9810308.1 TrkA family potassium uptake protein [Enterocloster citroniae]MCB7065295.1 TrkA family potassium uptake protein [Enterocloster citroniae]MCC3383880.1 TrkA family potassium uptake protein [Enterocloster citroniae]MCC8083463.1 TrkA family potassium uptake protein [Clostridium sp.]
MARKQAEELSYGIIGLGRFGSALASTLAEAGKEIMVLDCNEEKVRQIRNFTEHAYVVKDLQKETLRETGIQNCDVVVVCIGDKVDVSILTTLNVINLGVPQVVAKANSPEQGEILEKIGAQVVYPEKDMALRLAKRLISKRVFNLFELDHNIDISEFKLTSRLAGQTVLEAQLRNRYGVNIIAISRGGWLTTDITPDYTLAEGDTLVVIGERDKIKRLEDAL